MDKLTFSREPLMACWDEALPMVHQKWNEIPHPVGTPPFRPDRSQYDTMERVGIARLYTCRDEKRLVGYACIFVFDSPWHQGYREAAYHAIWLEPDYRKPRIIRRFFQYFEDDLRLEGVFKISGHSAGGHKGRRLLGYLGYTPTYEEHEKLLLEVVCQSSFQSQ
jgi:GNAT superfamily N-acetyltransferase